MTPARLDELLSRFRSRRIAVVGDFFLDKYLDVDPALAETSVETGKVAHQVVAVRCSPGAAGTVVNNLVSLEAGAVHCFGAMGDDGEGYSLRQELTRRGCGISGLVVSDQLMTPTYLKPRDATTADLSGEHSRYDTKNRRPTPDAIVASVAGMLEKILPDVDAVIALDQVEEADHGVITRSLRDRLAEIAIAHPKVIFWADSRRRIRDFRHMIIKPNQFETVGRDHPQPGEEVAHDDLLRALADLRRTTGAPVMVTRGPLGALVSDPEVTPIPGVRLEGPLDTTGAGDSVTAGTVLSLASGASFPEAALVGMLVASITSQQLATTGVARPDEVRARLRMWQSQQEAASTK
ncbi:MAG: carbohydrate kinase [Planctomycetaceae bacterium]|nr:carbohydrate kinase [Planctomycetaceae bacterium]